MRQDPKKIAHTQRPSQTLRDIFCPPPDGMIRLNILRGRCIVAAFLVRPAAHVSEGEGPDPRGLERIRTKANVSAVRRDLEETGSRERGLNR